MEETLDDIKVLSQKYYSCQAQVASLTVAKQEQDIKFRNLEEKFEAQVLQHEQDLKDSKSDIDYLTQQNKELKNALAGFSTNKAESDLEERFNKLNLAYERNLTIISSQESYITQVESQNQAFVDQIEAFRVKNEKLENKKKILTDENNTLRLKNKEIYENLEKVSREAEKIIGEYIKKEESRKNQQDEYMSVVKKHSFLEKKYKDLAQNYEKLEKEMVSKNERINSIRSSKTLNENRLKEEEKKNEDLVKRVKIFENSIKYQKKVDTNEISEIQAEQELKLAESERKLKSLAEKIEPLIKRNNQLEKLIEK